MNHLDFSKRPRKWRKYLKWWKRYPYGIAPERGPKFTKGKKVYAYKYILFGDTPKITYTASPKIEGARMYSLGMVSFCSREPY